MNKPNINEKNEENNIDMIKGMNDLLNSKE